MNLLNLFRRKRVEATAPPPITPDADHKPGGFFQQGDLLLHCELAQPVLTHERTITKGVLLHGEHTGHKHRIEGREGVDFEVFNTKGSRYLRVVNPVALRHEEHKEQKLPPGDYRIDQTKEYDNFDEAQRVKKHID